MRIGLHHSYLILASSDDAEYPFRHTLRIRRNLSDIISSWQAGTRISPIFGVDRFGTSDPIDMDFTGTHHVLFLGPIHPASVLELESHVSQVWLTMGMFNVVATLRSGRARRSVANFCRGRGYRYELWRVRDGQVSEPEVSEFVGVDAPWRSEVVRASLLPSTPDLAEALREYAPLMASALARSEKSEPVFMPDLRAANLLTIEILQAGGREADSLEKLSSLVTLNAALSRFTSQTFSGTTPIVETECHYWIHSLLGTATANRALVNIRKFLTNTLGAYHLPVRVEKYVDVKKHVPDLQADVAAWRRDYLSQTQLTSDEANEPLFPLIVYWSGRDNFKSNVNSLSAPLAALSSCNSLRWTLMTLTHEVSHAIMRGVLGVISFDVDDPGQSEEAAALSESTRAAPDLLSEIRRAFLIANIALEEAEALLAGIKDHDSDKRKILANWNHEVEELFVHVFDFLYFYGEEWERYVTGIWLSWSAVPNLGDRVRDYVLRTIGVLMSRDPEASDAPDIARADALKVLRRVQKQLRRVGASADYVSRAIGYLKHEWNDLAVRARARRDIVRFVKAFLFSETVATAIRSELGLTSDRKRRAGYKFTPRMISTIPLRSPLKFIEIYTTAALPSPSQSAWMLTTLAFNISNAT